MSTQHFLDLSKNSLVNYAKQFSTEPINLLQTNFTKMKTQIETVGFERMKITSNSTYYSVKHSYRIPYTEGFIGGTWLVVSHPAAGAATTYVSFVGGQCIKTIEVFISGKSVHKYSGRALIQYLMFANKSYEHNRAHLVTLMSGTIAANTATGEVYIPLLCEGNLGIMGEPIKPFPIGLTKSDMIIEIEFESHANICLSAPPATISTMTAAPYLLYRKYKGDIYGSRLIGNKNIGNDSTEPIFTYKIPDLQYYEKLAVTLATTLVDLQITQMPLFNKPSDCLALLVINSIDSGVDHMLGVNCPLMTLTKGNDYLYKHDSVLESIQYSLSKIGEHVYYTSTYPQYIIPFGHNIRNSLKDDVIVSGIDMFQQQINFSISATAAAHSVKLCAVFNSFTNIMSDGSCRTLYQYDPRVITISPIPKQLTKDEEKKE